MLTLPRFLSLLNKDLSALATLQQKLGHQALTLQVLQTWPAWIALLRVNKKRPSRAFQQELWVWDVFVCHAGPDKVFARLLGDRLRVLNLRCFVDEDSLPAGGNAVEALEAAARSAHIAVVLLSEEFFQRDAPQQELRWFLDGCKQNRNQVVPVFLGITLERCKELAAPLGLSAVTGLSGVRHASERQRFTGRPVHEEETMLRVIQSVRDITGV